MYHRQNSESPPIKPSQLTDFSLLSLSLPSSFFAIFHSLSIPLIFYCPFNNICLFFSFCFFFKYTCFSHGGIVASPSRRCGHYKKSEGGELGGSELAHSKPHLVPGPCWMPSFLCDCVYMDSWQSLLAKSQSLPLCRLLHESLQGLATFFWQMSPHYLK